MTNCTTHVKQSEIIIITSSTQKQLHYNRTFMFLFRSAESAERQLCFIYSMQNNVVAI